MLSDMDPAYYVPVIFKSMIIGTLVDMLFLGFKFSIPIIFILVPMCFHKIYFLNMKIQVLLFNIFVWILYLESVKHELSLYVKMCATQTDAKYQYQE